MAQNTHTKGNNKASIEPHKHSDINDKDKASNDTYYTKASTSNEWQNSSKTMKTPPPSPVDARQNSVNMKISRKETNPFKHILEYSNM